MSVRAVLYAALAALAACSPMSADAGQKIAATGSTRHPLSGLEVVPLTIASANGRHAFQVEVARSGEEQAKGLMFRTSMGADEGMIFPMEPARQASFWMKNTVISLDLVFIGPDKRIESIAANAVPYSLAPIGSKGSVSAVLELNAGRAAQLGLAVGDKISFQK